MELSTNAVLALIFGGGGLVALVAIVGGFVHSRRERLLTHAERMKSLELGLPLPEDPTTARIRAAMGPAEAPSDARSLAAQCFTTTGYIAGFGLLFAAGASNNPGIAYAIAASGGAIGVTGMICGTILASRATDLSSGSSSKSATSAASKPRFDPDAV